MLGLLAGGREAHTGCWDGMMREHHHHSGGVEASPHRAKPAQNEYGRTVRDGRMYECVTLKVVCVSVSVHARALVHERKGCHSSV